MSVAADYGREPGGPGIEIQLRQIVQHIDGNPAYFEHFSLGQLLRPHAFVYVAANRSDWSDGAKLIEDLGRANISCMNDVIGSAQSLDVLPHAAIHGYRR